MRAVFFLSLLFIFNAQAAEEPVLLESNGYHTCTTWGGTLQCWGSNRSGELGSGEVSDFSNVPLIVQGVPQNRKYLALALGAQHSCIILKSSENLSAGEAYCWGSNTYGQLGIGAISQPPSAQAIQFPEKLIGISAGAVHTCILSEKGAVYCFGRNNQGQLGNNSTLQSLVPTPVSGLSKKIIQIVSGDYHTCALHENGSVYCWGQNITGQLGTGSNESTLTPVQVRNASGDSVLKNVRALYQATSHTCAHLADQIQCWGNNASGQIRYNANSETPGFYNLPTPLSGLIVPTLGISGGLLHSCAWNKDGIQCWGDNAYGQGGPTQDLPRGFPNNFDLLNRPQLLSSGEVHTCGLDQNQKIWCWGDHSFGQLGSRSLSAGKSFQPILVEGLKYNE